MILWRIYYGDGKTFTHEGTSVKDAPAFGVQAVVQFCEVDGKHILSHHDYYWWDDELNRWMGGDFVGLIDALARCKGPVKFGRYLPPYQFQAILEKAQADPDFHSEGGSTVDGGHEGP